MESNQEILNPYLGAIFIEELFGISKLNIEFYPEKNSKTEFKHLILTGKNGSGKSSILNYLGVILRSKIDFTLFTRDIFSILPFDSTKNNTPNFDRLQEYLIGFSSKININNSKRDSFLNWENGDINGFFIEYFPSNRHHSTKRDFVGRIFEAPGILEKEIKPVFAIEFERFLFSQKVSQLDHNEKGNKEKADYYDKFLKNILEVFKRILDDESLSLEFDFRNYSFSFRFKDNRLVNVRDLPDGYFSVVQILLSIYSKIEQHRENLNNFVHDIKGIVLIDEPEMHLHLELQYEIMPLLTELFPKVQFIIATHSPAVISSIRNATVFDLSKKEYAPQSVTGESYSSLMESHFGLDNEFGPVADELLAKVKHIYLNGGTPGEKSKAIKGIITEYSDILTPTLRVELESTLIRLEATSQK